MNLADELRKLAALHQEGHLTPAEFADAKRRLLASDETVPTAAPVQVQTTTAGPKPDVFAGDVPAVSPPPTIEERRYRSSRWSAGNLFFPDALTLTPEGMLFRKGALFGSGEEYVAYAAVASFRVNHGLFLSDLTVETSGGSQPIFVNGLWKSDARELQERLRTLQRRLP